MTKFLGEEWASGPGLAGTGWRGPALLAGDFWQVCRSRSPQKFQLLSDRWAEAFLCFRLISTSGREEAWKTSWSPAPLGDEQTKGASGIWGTTALLGLRLGPQVLRPGWGCWASSPVSPTCTGRPQAPRQPWSTCLCCAAVIQVLP